MFSYDTIQTMNHIKCTISCGPYSMVHIIWTISYGSYHMDHIIWFISYGPYHMVKNIISPRYFWFHQESTHFTKSQSFSPRFFRFHQESTHFTKWEFRQDSRQDGWTQSIGFLSRIKLPGLNTRLKLQYSILSWRFSPDSQSPDHFTKRTASFSLRIWLKLKCLS